MKKLSTLFILCLSVVLVACNGTKKDEKESTKDNTTVAAASEEKNEVDTGVGKNGEASSVNPAFVDQGGEEVNMENVIRAETAKYLAAETMISGPNKFRHERNGIDLENQTVIRSNFDAIYSYAVYDVSGGLEISVPEYDLYQIVQVLDENSVTIGVVYPGETKSFTKDDLSYGDHVYLFMRTRPRTYDEKGMEEMRKRQDAVTVEAGSANPYGSEVKYDVTSFNKLRGDLIKRAITEGVIEEGFIDDIDDIKTPQYQMINTAGWAGLPAKHAYYFVVLPGDEGAKNGEHSSVTFEEPDLQYDRSAYWSITIYDEQGWVVTNPFNTNSTKAVPNEDGSITLNFNGGEDAINNIKVPKNWNALFRCYLPSSVPSIVEYRKDFVKNHKVLTVE
ncbi:lytic murein transglycosylase [Echinicola strongylocentroti]|uniref:Lytic murein transglycosylase n=1 Tax=Echinicola strongylocentroti TaxID=1795355 RepID=A0A2Z4INU2_9BACT|nr:DUF1254 domain-containing protein [Echinicola strongylocentroti]AWW32216.1 lytic murein transglycosylase [Echinicola strongylocentroti]